VPPYAVIADDLTGALDAGAGFAQHGLRAILPFSAKPEDAQGADVLLINTDSRDLSELDAARAVRDAAERLKAVGIARVYKKIDSVLRGHPGAELGAVLDVYGGRAAVAPAFPAQGRVTRDRIQYVHARPVEPFGGFLQDALGSAAARSDLFDAETDDDLAAVAMRAAANPVYRVWCGTAGLAAHVPAALHLEPQASIAPGLPGASRVAIIAGTWHTATLAQLRSLREAGWEYVSLPDPTLDANGAALEHVVDMLNGGTERVAVGLNLERGDDPEYRRRAAGSREVTARWVASLHEVGRRLRITPDLALVMTGGETAQLICGALGARSIEVTGEALRGIPGGVLQLEKSRVAVATKSGGFGDPNALLRTAEYLVRRR